MTYKLKKALYGLKQARRSWHERLSNFLLEQQFKRGKVDTTLFIKKTKKDILLVQIYIDGIIFGSYFLGLQIKQLDSRIFINQSKYCNDLLKRFGREIQRVINTYRYFKLH